MKVIKLLVFLIFLSSCKIIDFMFYPNTYVKINKDTDLSMPIVNDTIQLLNNSGNIEPTNKGKKPPRNCVLSNIGDYCIIKDNELVEILLDEIDLSLASLDIKKNYETKEVIVSLVPILNEVVLESKCQTIIRSGSYNYLPPISVKKGLNPEQVVITPVLDDSCTIIGYEIRYGAEERGCKGGDVLKRFYNCYKPKSPKKSSKLDKNYHLIFFNIK